MENKEITKQMLDYSKAAFEAGFNSMVMLQEQTTQAVDQFLKQSPWIPVQTKTFINEWSNIYKKSTLDLKEAAEKNYSKMEEFFVSASPSPKSKSKN